MAETLTVGGQAYWRSAWTMVAEDAMFQEVVLAVVCTQNILGALAKRVLNLEVFYDLPGTVKLTDYIQVVSKFNFS